MNPLTYYYVASQTPRPSPFVAHLVEARAQHRSAHRRRPLLLVALVAVVLALAFTALPAGASAAGPLDHIAVTVSPGTTAVGQYVTVTATAKDAKNATIASYNAPATWSDISGALSPAAPSDFANGVSTTTMAQVATPIRGDAISITSGGVTGKSASFDVAGPLDHFEVRLPSGSQAVGKPFYVTAYARDAAGSLVTNYTAPSEWFDSAGATGVQDDNFVGGVDKHLVVVSAPVRADKLMVKTVDGLGKSGSLNVVGPASRLQLSVPSSVDASGPFKVTAKALDSAGNVATSFSGAASWSDSAGLLSPAAPVDFVKGWSTSSAHVSSPIRGDVIRLSSGGMSAQASFTAFGPATRLDVRVPSSASASVPFTMTVYARDALGSVVTNYAPAGAFWVDAAGNPEPLATFAKGVSKTTVTWPVAAQKLVITASAPGTGVWGDSNPINVLGPFDHAVLIFKRTDGLSGCTSVTGTLVMKAVDTAGNLLSAYNDSAPEFLADVDGAPISPPTAASFVGGVSTTPNVSVSWAPELAPLAEAIIVYPLDGAALGTTRIC